jgi:hypothetical protein
MIRCRAGGDDTRPSKGVMVRCRAGEVDDRKVDGENITDCRRIAHEAARNLSMVGYTAKAKSVNVPGDMTLANVYSIFESTIPSVSPMMGFNWNYDCGCPDNNVLRQDCPR